MKTNAGRCLYCYRELESGEVDFHRICSRKFFGSPDPPRLPFSEKQMPGLGQQVIRSQSAVAGVQPKLSLHLGKTREQDLPNRFTIVGLWGNYILKPPAQIYPGLPELEDLTMHLAEQSGLDTVPHSLIRLTSGTLAYITRRIDRQKDRKVHMEDMCQLTGRLTEHKYKGSYEQIGHAIMKYSVNPGLDIVNFFEQVVFSYLTGNSDMHLKNFSLINRPGLGWVLSPAYDMVSSALVVEGDKEELALNLNGKKRRIGIGDFRSAMAVCRVPPKAVENLLEKLSHSSESWSDTISISFIPGTMKEALARLIHARRKVVFGE